MVSGWSAGIYRERTMIASEDKLQARVVLGVSLAMAGIFIYAAIDKIRDPLQFADSVAAFGILPAVFVSLLALALPPFEIACGLLMLAPRTRRIGALAITLLSAIFFTALASALLRGLTLDCGCFGAGAPSRPRMWLELVLDMVLFASALWVYLRSITQPSLE
ncbi:MAG: MauE/DoxX family redox-associated membrane protein [Candidatus Binatus sp.]|uniref:MauE/DoxX family redox-associated membrane protein n=2 Tax=Candidatus Binatus sp. TaxID=2811406 RepID=UPI003BAFBB69